jgi:hypothetical protein
LCFYQDVEETTLMTFLEDSLGTLLRGKGIMVKSLGTTEMESCSEGENWVQP